MKTNLRKDFIILLIGIVVTILLGRSGAIHTLLGNLQDAQYLAAFVAGIFFTSVFTLVPATVVLGSLSLEHPPLIIALLGGAGAVIGDLVLFLFVRDRVVKDIDTAMAETHRKPLKVFRLEFLRWLNPILGALILLSPFPDELGLALLGFSKISTKKLVVLSFVMNTLGILLVGVVAKSIT